MSSSRIQGLLPEQPHLCSQRGGGGTSVAQQSLGVSTGCEGGENLQDRQPQLRNRSVREEGLGLGGADPGQGVRPSPLLSSWAATAGAALNGFSRFPQKKGDRVAPPGLAHSPLSRGAPGTCQARTCKGRLGSRAAALPWPKLSNLCLQGPEPPGFLLAPQAKEKERIPKYPARRARH